MNYHIVDYIILCCHAQASHCVAQNFTVTPLSCTGGYGDWHPTNTLTSDTHNAWHGPHMTATCNHAV